MKDGGNLNKMDRQKEYLKRAIPLINNKDGSNLEIFKEVLFALPNLELIEKLLACDLSENLKGELKYYLGEIKKVRTKHKLLIAWMEKK